MSASQSQPTQNSEQTNRVTIDQSSYPNYEEDVGKFEATQFQTFDCFARVGFQYRTLKINEFIVVFPQPRLHHSY